MSEWFTIRKKVRNKNKKEIIHMEHMDKEKDSMGDATFAPTMAGYPNGYHNYGFEPSDAALVQSNNLSIHQSQLAFQIQQLNESISRNSKENVMETMRLRQETSDLKTLVLQQSADFKATLQSMEIARLNNAILELKITKPATP